jgi:hypothetical protein
VTWELYDLSTDSKESRDVQEQEPGRTAALRRDIEVWLKSVVQSLNGGDHASE